jgi:hypothetical protein
VNLYDVISSFEFLDLIGQATPYPAGVGQYFLHVVPRKDQAGARYPQEKEHQVFWTQARTVVLSCGYVYVDARKSFSGKFNR